MSILVFIAENVIPLAAYFMLGLRFAYRFMRDNIHKYSTVADVVDVTIASIMWASLWPLLFFFRLAKEA